MMYPVYTRRILVLVTIPLLLWFSYLLLREIGLNWWPSLSAAIAYTFSSYYMYQVDQGLNHLSGFFIPALAMCLVRLFKKPTPLLALITSMVAAGALYFTEYALLNYMAVLLFAVMLALFSDERQLFFNKLHQLGIKWLCVSGLLFLLLALPFGINWFASEATPPNPSEASWYSSNLLGFFVPNQEVKPLYTSIFSTLNEKMLAQGTSVGTSGFGIFIGFPLLIFGFISVFKTRLKLVSITLLIALIFFVLSLGPTLKIFTFDTGLWLPYAFLASLPPFNVGRAPVRMAVLGLFLWMIVAAYGWQWFETMALKSGRRVAWVVLLLISLWVAAEAYTPLLKTQQIFVIPPQIKQIDGPVIELPLKLHQGWALLLQMFYRQPLAVGEVSRNSPQQLAHFETLRVWYAEALQTGSCRPFEEMGFRYAIIRAGVPDDVVQGLSHSANCSLKIIDLR